MQIFVLDQGTGSGKSTITLDDLKPESTVEGLRQKIEMVCGVARKDYNLLFAGKSVGTFTLPDGATKNSDNESKTLADFDIRKETTIRMVRVQPAQ